MRKVNITLYEFKELAKDIQEELIEDNWNINIDNNYWYESIIDTYEEILMEYGFTDVNIYFNIAEYQSGACFTSKEIDIHKYLKKVNKSEKYDFSEDDMDNIHFEISKRNNSINNFAAITLEDYRDEVSKQHLFDELYSEIHTKIMNFCGKIEEDLQSEYNVLTGMPAIIQSLSENEYLIDGKVFNMEVN